MNSKKFSILFICIIGLFLFLNLLLWHLFVKQTFLSQDGHGGLNRLGFYCSSKPTTQQINYKNKHIDFLTYIEMQDKPQVEILTIGDSFSNGSGGCYYQDYIVDHYNKMVLNVRANHCYDAVTCLRLLEKLGYLKEIQPKFILLESVERQMHRRFAMEGISVPFVTKESFLKKLKKADNNVQKEAETKWAPNIMIKANISYLYNKLKYRKSVNKLSDDVYVADLNVPLFSNPQQETKLLFYYEDLWFTKRKADCEKINNLFNNLADELSIQGMQLIFMTCVDKFDLYYPYIQNREQYKMNNFFEVFEKLPKRYVFVNTKQILNKMLMDNEKDIYWLDDTHWSWKGQQRVMDYLMEIME